MIPRRSPVIAYFAAIVCFILCATSTMSACGQGQRKDTLRASLTAVNAARKGFLDWDRDHQKAIVDRATSRQEAEEHLADYQATQGKIADWFVAAYQALAVASTQNDELSLSAAVRASGDLVDAVTKILKGG
jgi:hypothetical protein